MDNDNLQILLAPNMNIPPSKDIPIENDDAFDYEGYQVVRGEFFAHTYEPSFTFNKFKVSVNAACIKKLPNVEYVQILVNPNEKKLIVKPCFEEEKDSFKWRTRKNTPKQIKCTIFFAKIINLMHWDPSYRYKILGKLIKSNDQLLFVFDLTTPEIYIRVISKEGKEVSSRKASYPEEWQNQFGVPASEHQMNLQVNIFDGYAVYDIQESNNTDNQIANKERQTNE